MKKETISAIVFGLMLGILAAVVVIIQSKSNQRLKIKPIGTLDKSISPEVKITTKAPFLEIKNPTDKKIIDTDSVIINGRANKNSTILIQSPIKDLIFKNEKEEFKIDFPLVLGENMIEITSYPADKTFSPINKELRVYYLNINQPSE